jgi:hypothetical protein
MLVPASAHGVWLFEQSKVEKPFTIMLDPAGDAQIPGRLIEDSFERGLTLQFAHQLKDFLEQTNSNVRIILTRMPNETIEQLQNANFANRLSVDLYLSIHFYYERTHFPSFYIYHFLYNPITDFWAKSQHSSFVPYDQAHLSTLTTVTRWGTYLKNSLHHDHYKRLFDVKGLYGIPFRPLIGIKAPALALEIGLKNKQQSQLYVEPLATSLTTLIKAIGETTL